MSVSKFIPNLGIYIVVLRELSELAPWPASAEHIAADRYPNCIRKIVLHLGVEQIVAVRQTIEGKQRQSQGLVQEKRVNRIVAS